MKPILAILFFLTGWFMNSHVFGQTENLPKEITIKKSFLFGPKYYQDNLRISTASLKYKIKKDPKAYPLYKRTLLPDVLGNLLGAVGGFGLGWGVASRNKSILLIGGVSLLTGTMFSSYVNKARKVSIGIYNKNLRNGGVGYKENPQFQFTGNGICLTF